jgi:hypothetical protein
MNAVATFAYDLAYPFEAILGAVVCLERTACLKTRPRYDEDYGPEENSIFRIEWTIDEDVAVPRHAVNPTRRFRPR